jgi:hypothetical protein
MSGVLLQDRGRKQVQAYCCAPVLHSCCCYCCCQLLHHYEMLQCQAKDERQGTVIICQEYKTWQIYSLWPCTCLDGGGAAVWGTLERERAWCRRCRAHTERFVHVKHCRTIRCCSRILVILYATLDQERRAARSVTFPKLSVEAQHTTSKVKKSGDVPLTLSLALLVPILLIEQLQALFDVSQSVFIQKHA